MANSFIKIKDYYPTQQESFFFDNNIWMFLFSPIAQYQKEKQKTYSRFFEKALESGSTIFTSSLILSEFVNRNLRMAFDRWKEMTSNYSAQYKKDYIGCNDYKINISLIKKSVKKILASSEKISDNFRNINIDKIQSLLEIIDYNDSYILELASSQRFSIVTDDKDFLKIETNVHIIGI